MTERLLRLKLAKMALRPGAAMRRHRAHAVALRRLDLDDLGAEVAQDLGGVGAEDDRGQVENAQAFEQGDHAGPPGGEDRAGERRPAVARAIPDRLPSRRAQAHRGSAQSIVAEGSLHTTLRRTQNGETPAPEKSSPDLRKAERGGRDARRAAPSNLVRVRGRMTVAGTFAGRAGLREGRSARGRPTGSHACDRALRPYNSTPALTWPGSLQIKRSFVLFCALRSRRQAAPPRAKPRRGSWPMPKLKPEVQRARSEHILDAAEQCFARAGFHRTTIHDICKEASVSPGALYVYFDSKEALIAGISERDRAEFAERLDPRRRPRFPRGAADAGRAVFPRGAGRQPPHVHRDRPGIHAQSAHRRDPPEDRPLHLESFQTLFQKNEGRGPHRAHARHPDVAKGSCSLGGRDVLAPRRRSQLRPKGGHAGRAGADPHAPQSGRRTAPHRHPTHNNQATQ